MRGHTVSQLVEEAGPQTIPKRGQTGEQSGWPGQLQVLAVFQDLPSTDARTVLCFLKCKCRGVGNCTVMSNEVLDPRCSKRNISECKLTPQLMLLPLEHTSP